MWKKLGLLVQDMFAVFKTGGKQYKVTLGDVLLIEKLSANEGDKIRFNEVLALSDKAQTIGTPTISGACVEGEILAQTKGKKTINFVKRRRKHSSQRKKGHRQNLTLLKVLQIKSDQKTTPNPSASFEVIGKSTAKDSNPKLMKTKIKTSVSEEKSKTEPVTKKSAEKKAPKQTEPKSTPITKSKDAGSNKKEAKNTVVEKKDSSKAKKKSSNSKPSGNKTKS